MFVYRSIVNTFVSVTDWHQHIVAYVEYKNTQSTPTRTGVHTEYLIMLTPAIKLAARISMCEQGFSIIDEFGLIALLGLGPSLKHGLGSLLSLLLLPALHGLDHGDLFGLLFLVPRLKQQPGVKRRRGRQTM